MSTLYVVGTPIGNLGDITFRAIETLKSVDIIFCEDTRVTRKLLNHFDIHKPTTSFHANSTDSVYKKIFSMLADGKNLALVSDAGTPGISDPGLKLVSFIREKAEELAEKDGEEISISIVPIPGPSALTTALSVAGVPISTFTFYGFLPHKKGRQTLFIEIASSERASVFYESPHRIEKTMAELLVRLAPERRVVIARELTKMFEQVVVGSAAEIVEKIKKGEIPIKGEFVVIVV